MAVELSYYLGYGLKSWVTSTDLTSDEFSVQLEPLIKGWLQQFVLMIFIIFNMSLIIGIF